MANAANTAWKLTDLWNTALFTFDSTYGWHPTNENQSVDLAGENYTVAYRNILQRRDYGLGGRPITLIGEEVADEDVWKLSSAICKRQLMKLWVGEDWFYYVLGREPRQVRDESAPYQKTYTLGLIAVDPHYYYSNSAAGSSEISRSLVVPDIELENAGSLDVDLTDATSAQGTTFVEPCFWIKGGTNTSVTKVTITDLNGRKLEYSPTTTITDTHEHVIMPYRNTALEGFMVKNATGFCLTAAGAANTVQPTGIHGDEIAGDNPFDVFQHGAGTDDSGTANSNVYGWIQEETPCILTRNGTSFIPKKRNYPRCEDGVVTILTVSYTGTSTDITTYGVWVRRRV